MSFVTLDDFKGGIYKIPFDPNQQFNDFQPTADRVEREILSNLLGVTLYNDLLANPTDPQNVKIFDPILQDYEDCVLDSKGIKNMLRGFTYFDIVRDRMTRVTTVNMEKGKTENSKPVYGTTHDIIMRHNNAVDTYRAIQFYIEKVDPDSYPDYNGQPMDYATPF